MKKYKFKAYRDQNDPFVIEYCDVLDLGFLCKKAVRLGAIRIIIDEIK